MQLPLLTWNVAETPEELHGALRALAEEYPICEGEAKNGCQAAFRRAEGEDGLTVSRRGAKAVIRYGARRLAGRGLSALWAGLAGKDEYHEPGGFTTLGLMVDCSRNAVKTVSFLKGWLRRMALLGYNQLMLYTEDTYEIPGEGYFGYLRGRYTGAELRELDAYAASLGVELVGCIQTLAHLEQILRWPAYREVRDYESTMLVDEEQTYALIGKMLDVVSSHIRSRRIHIGMDEAMELGRGAYLDRHGERKPFEMLNRHLARVVEMCEARGLAPMIWSDMYFRIGSRTHDYYDPSCVIPEAAARRIPSNAQLVYWDYYHREKKFYLDWIARHRALGKEPVMASGIWTWSLFWYGRQNTEGAAGPCLDACRESGLKELAFTLWGDDGGYCDYDSALAGVVWAAERAHQAPHPASAAKRFRAVCGGDYAAVLLAAGLNEPVSSPGVLWDDPLLGIYLREVFQGEMKPWAAVARRWAGLGARLRRCPRNHRAGDLAHAALLAEVLARKIRLRLALQSAYGRRDRQALTAAAREARSLAQRLCDLRDSFRRLWLRQNKPFGLEVLQIRLSGQVERHQEMARRIAELLAGKVDGVAELDERLPAVLGKVRTNYRGLASGSVIL